MESEAQILDDVRQTAKRCLDLIEALDSTLNELDEAIRRLRLIADHCGDVIALRDLPEATS